VVVVLKFLMSNSIRLHSEHLLSFQLQFSECLLLCLTESRRSLLRRTDTAVHLRGKDGPLTDYKRSCLQKVKKKLNLF